MVTIKIKDKQGVVLKVVDTEQWAAAAAAVAAVQVPAVSE